MTLPGHVLKDRERAVDAVRDRLRSGETVIAVLPFAVVPKRPRGPEGKVREGLYQSYRRYRPVVLTTQRMFVINSGRTPQPRGVLTEFPAGAVTVVDVVPARWGQRRLRLDLPGEGVVPFDLGKFELDDLEVLRAALAR